MVGSSSENKVSDTGDRDWYKSVIVRTGIAYRYKTSLIFMIVTMIAAEPPLFLSIVPTYLALIDTISWTIYPVVVMFMTYIMKNTIDDFTKMFDLFEERVYNPSDRIMRIFPSKTEFNAFRIKARGLIFSSKELVFGLLGALVITIAYHPWDWHVGPAGGLDYLGYNDMWTAIRAWIILPYNAIVCFLLGAGLWVILGIIVSISLIGRAGVVPKSVLEDTSHSDTAPNRATDLGTKARITYFSEFQDSVRQVGVFMYRFCSKIIVMAFILVLLLIMVDVGFTTAHQIQPGTTFVSIAMLSLVFVLFVLPQLSIHNLLVRFKERIMLDLNVVYEETQRALVQSLHDPNFFKVQSRWENGSQIRGDCEIIDRLLAHVEKTGTWSFRFPAVLKLIIASALPLLTVILQTLASGLLQHLL
jgi:hypothetical protein